MQLRGRKGQMAWFDDNSRVVFRPKSRDGSPVVEIVLTAGKRTDKLIKIHFVKGINQ